MESASESPSAWSDVMAVSDDSDLLSDEYINHNHISSQNYICPDGPSTSRAYDLQNNHTHHSSLIKNISPLEPPAEFRDYKTQQHHQQSTALDSIDDSESSAVETYSSQLSKLVLQETIDTLTRRRCNQIKQFQSKCPVQSSKSHKIIRPKPTRLRKSYTFQTVNRQNDLNIYSNPIDTINKSTTSKSINNTNNTTNNNNNIVMAHVHEILNDLYSTPSNSRSSNSYNRKNNKKYNKNKKYNNNNNSSTTNSNTNSLVKHQRNKQLQNNSFVINIKKNKKVNKKSSLTSTTSNNTNNNIETGHTKVIRNKNVKLKKIKQTICNLFTFKTTFVNNNNKDIHLNDANNNNTATESVLVLDVSKASFAERELPPLPSSIAVVGGGSVVGGGAGGNGNTIDVEIHHNGVGGDNVIDENCIDFASSIEKVKDYGWYWGPISCEDAEKILSTEPDGSFIVRDSSDDHYIFSLTFKLNDFVRHVRIEHYQGNFSFGSCTKFKSHTIVDFIENAVEHSRSGRYLFFLHRRPVLGPMRVQLLHPVSRFKQIQSLQHMCRFVILKIVRKDHINELPLPERMKEYLNTPHYYCENENLTTSTE